MNYQNGNYYPPPPYGNDPNVRYKKPLNSVLAVIVWLICWPVGIFLVWKTSMPKPAKWVLTLFPIAVLSMAVALNDPSNDSAERLQESTQELQESVQHLEDSLGISEDTVVQETPAYTEEDPAYVEETLPASYNPVTIEDLRAELEANALRAQQTYLDQYVEFSGTLDTIDSSGDYFTLKALSAGEWDLFETIHCSITDPSQLDTIINHNTGDTLTVQGKVTTVGEVLGYVVDVHSVS